MQQGSGTGLGVIMRGWGQWVALSASAVVIAACVGPAQVGVNGKADDRAERAGTVMFRERDGDALDMVRRVVGGDPLTTTAIEALVADGDRFDGRIVLRITERDDHPTFGDEPVTAVRCYEYRLRDGVDDFRGRHVDCPDLPASVIPDPPPPPTVPDGIDTALLGALEQLATTAASEAEVRAAVAPLAAGAAVFDVAEVPGSGIGIAVGNGEDECVTGRITTDGVAEVWRVPRVVAQPGELGCSAVAAAQGLGKDAPH